MPYKILIASLTENQFAQDLQIDDIEANKTILHNLIP